MFRTHKAWIAVALVGLSGAALVVLRRPTHIRPHATDESAADRFHGFSSRPFSNSGLDVPQPDMSGQAAQVAGQMMRWRTAILDRDERAVIACDLDFRQSPERYRRALEASAETDENERVRAFSTRVLGKMKVPAEAPLFQRLLGDASPYVRQNAAWGLGELRSEGAIALRELRRAEAHDSAEAVRAAAKDALGKIE
jgi:hypothetical protein